MNDSTSMEPAPPSPDSSLLTGNLRTRMFGLALPALGEQLLNFCVGLFDVFLAGRLPASGSEVGVATSAVGIAAYLSWLGTLLFAVVGAGTTALVARSWGAGETRSAQRFANCGFALAGILGVLVFALLYTLAPGYARLQNLQGESEQIVVGYLRTDAIGQMFYGFCLVGTAALRGAGDMRTSLYVLGLVNLLNMGASTLFTFGGGPIPAFGIQGIVYGTVVARMTGSALMGLVLATGVSRIRLHFPDLRPRLSDARRMLRIGLPAAADGVTMWLGQSLFVMIIARLGNEVMGKANLAAHVIGIEVEALSYLPATAWGYAAATLIGQSLGGGDKRRALRAGHEAARQGMLFATGMSALFFFGAGWIYSVLSVEPLVREVGVPAMRMLSWYQIPLIVVIIYMQALRGAGDTKTVLWINLIGVGCIRLPLAWYLGLHCGYGLLGAWTAMTIDVTSRALIVWSRYRQGRWLHLEV